MHCWMILDTYRNADFMSCLLGFLTDSNVCSYKTLNTKNVKKNFQNAQLLILAVKTIMQMHEKLNLSIQFKS